MAVYVLLNDTNLAGAKLRAGKQIDDTYFDIPALTASGAQLVPFDPVSASIGSLFEKLALRGGGGNLDPGQPIPLAHGVTGQSATSGALPFLAASTWFIKSDGGHDSAAGTSEMTPLKTFAELQRRLGIWTTVSPNNESKTLTIQIIGESLADPITFRNFIDKNCTVFIKGQKKVLATGTTISAVDRDRANNVPFQVEAAITWADYLGKAIHITSGPAAGSYAWLARDMGGGFVHVSTWGDFTHTEGDGFVLPALAPSTSGGETFEILDFTEVTLGDMTFGASEAEAFNPGIGGLVLDYLKLTSPFGGVSLPASVYQGHSGIAHSIFDRVGINSRNTIFGNCCFNGSTVYQEGTHAPGADAVIFLISGLFRAAEEFTFNGMDLRRCQVTAGGDPTFVGLPEAAQTDLFMWGGIIQLGPISFWDTFHGLQVNRSWCTWEPFEPLSGEFGYVPLWGNGNFGFVGMVDGSFMSINQYNEGGDAPLPTLENAGGPGGIAIATRAGWAGAGDELEVVAHTFDETSGPPAGFTVAHPTEWARFNIDRGNGPGDGFRMFVKDYDGFVITKASAVWPESGNRVTRNMGVVL